MKAKDIFTPGRFPTHTYVESHLAEKKKNLRGALEAGGLVISVSGPSKSGKTVFVENEIGKDNLLHVTGAGIDSTQKLWGRIFDLIGTPLSEVSTTAKSFSSKIEGSAGGEAGFLVKGQGKVGASGTWSNSQQQAETTVHDALQLIIKEIKDSGYYILIDDFHYVSESTKTPLAEEIKECIRQGLTILVASVPYRTEDVIRGNKDFRGRMLKLDFDYWDSKFLYEIGSIGFGLLNLEVEDKIIEKLVSEASGSPQLMQALCLNFCFECEVYEGGEPRKISYTTPLLDKVCQRTALMNDYSSAVGIMREGPKTRGTVRHTHRLAAGGEGDVYSVVLKALSSNPPKLTFRYSDLVNRINSICLDDGPVGSSVTGACEHMSRLANEAENSSITEWDSEHDVFDIRDPYLLFYLRWGE